MGEAQILPWELKENRSPCGCGVSIAECDFWQALFSQIPLYSGDYPIEHFREKHNAGRVLRWPHLAEIWRRRQSPQLKSAAQEYGRLNAQYFRSVWQAAERRTPERIRWLVDASKDMYRFHWLQQSNLFDFRVIHLMKDPRAFVYSMTKNNLGSVRKSIRYAGRWLIENRVYSHICADPDLKGKTFHLRYEDLASQPGGALREIGAWLDVDFSDVSYHEFRDHENHAVSGNPMRWRDTRIVLDVKWRRTLPKHAAAIVWAMTGFLARKYGYHQQPLQTQT